AARIAERSHCLNRDGDEDERGKGSPGLLTESFDRKGEEPEKRRQGVGQKARSVAGAPAPVRARVEHKLRQDRRRQAKREDAFFAMVGLGGGRKKEKERGEDEQAFGRADQLACQPWEERMLVERMRAAEPDDAIAAPDGVEEMDVVVHEGNQDGGSGHQTWKSAKPETEQKERQQRCGKESVGRPIRDEKAGGQADTDGSRLRRCRDGEKPEDEEQMRRAVLPE